MGDAKIPEAQMTKSVFVIFVAIVLAACEGNCERQFEELKVEPSGQFELAGIEVSNASHPKYGETEAIAVLTEEGATIVSADFDKSKNEVTFSYLVSGETKFRTWKYDGLD